MRRLPLPLVVIALCAIGLSACDSNVTPFAAKVGSATISTSSLNQSLQSIASDSGLRCYIAQNNPSGNTGVSSIAMEGSGSGTFDSSFVASQLTSLIDQQELAASLRDLGLHANASDDGLAVEQLQQQFDPVEGSACTASGQATLSSLPTSYRNFVVAGEVAQDLVAAHLAGIPLSSAGLTAYVGKNPNSARLACISVIETSSLSDASAARQAVEQGASFAAVAKAKSIDPSSAPNGGVIGCYSPSELESPLDGDVAALATGAVSMPIAYDGGYLDILVTKRETPTIFQALNALVTAQSSAVQRFVAGLAASDRVTVDSRYGTWKDVDGGFQVVPPSGPVSSDLTNPLSITPAPIQIG